MIRILWLISVFWLAASMPLYTVAQEDHSSHHSTKDAKQDAASPLSPDELKASTKRRIDAGLATIQNLMTQIENTPDSEDRDCLLGEHALLMLDQIEVMREQSGGKMAAKSKANPSRMSDCMTRLEKKDATSKAEDKAPGTNIKHGGMMGMHKEVQQRLDRLEQLMEQLIRHTRARETLAP